MAHIHSVYDTDPHFSIDAITRVITNQSTGKTAIIQHDHNSERFTFELPRHIDGHDMSLCNKIEVHFLNVASDKSGTVADVYPVDDMQISPESDDVIIFSWLLSNNATQMIGSLNFLVRFACLTGNVIDYVWNTSIHKGIVISEGMNNASLVIEQYSDVLEAWKAGIEESTARAVAAATNAEALAARAEAAANTAAVELERLNYSSKVKSGSVLAMHDSSNLPFVGMKIHGKSTQDGTPTPDAPVDIVNVLDGGNVAVYVQSGNFLSYPYNGLANNDKAEVTWTVNDDRSISVKGTPTAQRYYAVVLQYKLPKGVYTLSGCPSGGEYQKYWMYVQRKSDNYVWYEVGNGVTFEATEEDAFDIAVNVGVNAGTISNLTFRPMLNYGNEALAYEPYTKKAIAFSAANGLRGIPVSSGGNYTDANGQQWICDEVDLARGVLVQRVFKEEVTFAYDEINNRYSIPITHTANAKCADGNGIPVLCDILEFNPLTGSGSPVVNGIRVAATSPKYVIAYYNGEAIGAATVCYPLAEPIESALSDSEIAAYKALHSNNPTTTIFNDAGAEMTVEYITESHDGALGMLNEKIDEVGEKTNELKANTDEFASNANEKLALLMSTADGTLYRVIKNFQAPYAFSPTAYISRVTTSKDVDCITFYEEYSANTPTLATIYIPEEVKTLEGYCESITKDGLTFGKETILDFENHCLRKRITLTDVDSEDYLISHGGQYDDYAYFMGRDGVKFVSTSMTRVDVDGYGEDYAYYDVNAAGELVQTGGSYYYWMSYAESQPTIVLEWTTPMNADLTMDTSWVNELGNYSELYAVFHYTDGTQSESAMSDISASSCILIDAYFNPNIKLIDEVYALQNTVSDHEYRISAIEAALCLQEGTQILMADGTTKNIEDVQYGDMLMTWDIDNNCTIPCKSYGNVFTGYTTSWENFCFDNGSVLKISDNHRIYKADKQIPVLASKWKLGDKSIASNGALATFYYAPKNLPAAIERRKFSVLCETGLYFANDILCGHLLSQPLNVNQRTHGALHLTEEDKAVLLEYATAREQEHLVELQYPEYMKESLPYRQKKEMAEQKIKDYKKKLAGRDYKTIKAMQGKLTDAEITENITACEDLRSKINKKEIAIQDTEANIKELQAKYNIQIRPLAAIETENIKKAIAKAREKYLSEPDSNESAEVEVGKSLDAEDR